MFGTDVDYMQLDFKLYLDRFMNVVDINVFLFRSSGQSS